MNKQEEPSNGASGRALTTRHNEQGTGLTVINLLDEKQLASAELFLKKFMSSEKGGIKSIADGLSILARAQDLQLPFTTCIEHIHVINGKTGIDIHIIKSLLSRAGIVWKCTKDYVPQYQYTDGNTIYLETQLPQYCVKCRTPKEAIEVTKDETVGVYPVHWYADLKGNIYNEFEVSDKCVKAINRQHALKIASEGKFPVLRIPAQPIDFVTEYEFTRRNMINGKEVITTTTSHFSFSEAQTADLFKKDTYVKYARIMIGHRAFVFGACDIADDILMGCMETTELNLITDAPINDAEFSDAEVIEVSN